MSSAVETTNFSDEEICALIKLADLFRRSLNVKEMQNIISATDKNPAEFISFLKGEPNFKLTYDETSQSLSVVIHYHNIAIKPNTIYSSIQTVNGKQLQLKFHPDESVPRLEGIDNSSSCSFMLKSKENPKNKGIPVPGYFVLHYTLNLWVGGIFEFQTQAKN